MESTASERVRQEDRFFISPKSKQSLAVNFQMAEDFLTLLDEKAEGLFTFQTFDDNKLRKDPKLARVLNGKFDDLKEKLTALDKQGAGIFVTVNETDLQGRQKPNIKRVRAVFQEDDGEGKALPVEPHITVNTSPGHYHRYILTDSLEPAEFGQVMDTMISDYGSDPNAFDICRVLRLPGFFHKKDPNNPFMVRLVDQSNALPLSGEAVKSLFPSKKKTIEDNSNNQDSADIQSFIKQILSGEVYHTNLLRLAASYIGSGASGRITRGTLQALMQQSSDKDKRWTERYQQIPDLVKSAIKKYRTESLQPELITPVKGISCADLLTKQFPPRENLLPPWLPVQGLCMVHAYRGVGKTHFSIGVACAVATASTFLKWKAEEPRGVLFIDGEMPGSVIKERLAQTIAGMDGNFDNVNLQIITPDLQEFGMPDLATIEGQALIKPFITDNIDLIILDNVSTLCSSVQENKGDSWRPMQGWLLRLRARGKTVLLIHHDGKGGIQRGTSKKEDILDTVIQLKHPAQYSPSEGAVFEVHFRKNREVYGEDAEPFEAKLMSSDDKATWLIRKIEDSTMEKVKKLLDEGYKQKDIALELEITAGRVSQLVRQFSQNQSKV